MQTKGCQPLAPRERESNRGDYQRKEKGMERMVVQREPHERVG
ncbi:MAG TPA: hypothetical protein VM715_08695 [Candidatus Acidoferrum sp.]|nr:hypothetical protein [Candidatus Acidoferrum sp.]